MCFLGTHKQRAPVTAGLTAQLRCPGLGEEAAARDPALCAGLGAPASVLSKETGKKCTCCHRCRPHQLPLFRCLKQLLEKLCSLRSSLCTGRAERSSYSLPQRQHSHGHLQGLESTLGKPPPVTPSADPAAPRNTSTPERSLPSALLVAGTARIDSKQTHAHSGGPGADS